MAAPLAIDSTLKPDDLLDRFTKWVESTGISLYEAQQDAILALLEGKHVVLSTPTGSGKSLVATFLHFASLAEGKRSFYTCPIKALVNEKFFALCEVFGPENVGMMTGDASVNRDAPIVCCTAEILVNLAIREDVEVHSVVMDEFHYYADRDRGTAWQVPLLLLEKTRFLLMSATLGDTTAIEESLKEVTGRDVTRVKSAVRPVPLTFEYMEIPLHETIEKLIGSGRYPVYLVNFTQRAAAEQAQNLMSVNFSTREEKAAISAAIQDVAFTTPFGKDIQRHLRHGIGLHHAGLLPRYRLTVEKLAQAGLLKVISGTDTLGMGINVPLKTVLFTQLCKYDGTKTAILSARDFHQIAGRAGRKGFDDQGYVVAQAPEHVIENKKLAAKEKAGKKVVKQKPPERGYVHWDEQTFRKLIVAEPETLESRFDVSFGLLLQMLQSVSTRRGGGYGRLVEMIARSHGSPKERHRQRVLAAQRFRTLRGAGIVTVHRVPGGGGSYVRAAGELQRDFSLLHTLSLYLVHSLTLIPRDHEDYALNILSQVESILEDPDVVLFKQLDRIKTEKMIEMKSKGIEYDERIAELEKLEYPKPNRDFVYSTFNEFAAKHPWVGSENIRPKSVAREMLERYVSFNDYVRDYGLERSEGVLLRYLSQAYKVLVQTVPEGYRTDELDDVIADLGAVVRGVDASLLDEWEKMRDPAYVPAATPEQPPREAPEDTRASAAKIRRELHLLVRAIAAKDYAAAAAIAGSEPAAIEEPLAAYWAEHPKIDVTPASRKAEHSVLKRVAPKTWEASQRIVDEAGEADWVIECDADLTKERILSLRRIGT